MSLRRGSVTLLALVFFAPQLIAQQISFADPQWKFGGDSTRVETFDGRQTLRMETGSASRPDIIFQDGTIDVDLMTSRRRSFAYVTFRAQNEGEHEEFYLRPHKSGLADAAQYAPVYQGQSAWQLYWGPRGTAAPDIVPNVWQHLRIVVAGRRAAFFLNDTTKPFMVVPRLARDPQPGYIAFTSLVPVGTPGRGPAVRYANLVVRPSVVAYDFANAPVEPALPTGIVGKWELGPAFAAPDSAVSTILPEWTASFRVAPIEPDGFVELHRVVPMPRVTNFVGIVARIRVTAQRAMTRPLDLGFSDRVTLFLNGSPIFFRDDSYDFFARRDGLISLNQARVFLPLRAGANDISLVITDRFGGWGIMARFPDATGLRIEP
ncbi:MAG TPA: hypothetical protein VJ852_07640 [Gemmatimonadaceae bacterium]|nr:hypothetical protein [Gemmatimonadaceae bacterium]